MPIGKTIGLGDFRFFILMHLSRRWLSREVIRRLYGFFRLYNLLFEAKNGQSRFVAQGYFVRYLGQVV